MIILVGVILIELIIIAAICVGISKNAKRVEPGEPRR